MYWLKEKYNRLTQKKTAHPKDNPDIPTPPEKESLAFENPLFNYVFDIGADLNTMGGKVMPVIKKLALDKVMSTVRIAEWQNIKAMAPVLAADIMTSGLLYLMKCSWEDDKKDLAEINLYCTFLLGSCMAIQTGAWVYDSLIGRQTYLKLLLERQLMTVNLTPVNTTNERGAACTKECGSFKNMTQGNLLKMAHFYTNQLVIDQIIRPIPFAGPGLSIWFGIMAKGRALVDLTTHPYCRNHETLNPETVMAAGLWHCAQEWALSFLLTKLGVSPDNIYTRHIIQEIALIFSTALLLHANFPVIRKKSPVKRLDLEKQDRDETEEHNIKNQLMKIASQVMKISGMVIMSNPLRYIEEAVEWAMGAILIGTAMQLSMQEQSDTKWSEIRTRVEAKLNHPWVRTAQIHLLPTFLHSWDNLANHPPIKDQWQTKRNLLIFYLGKTFAVRTTVPGKMTSYSPKYAAKILQLFFGIQASVAQTIIEKLGEVQTRLLLKEIYWWLGVHGATESAGLTGVEVLFPKNDATITFTQPAISKDRLSDSASTPVIMEEARLPIVPFKSLPANEPFMVNEVPAIPFSSPTNSPKRIERPLKITEQRGTFFPRSETRSNSPKGISKEDLEQENPQLRHRGHHPYKKNTVWSKESLDTSLEKFPESKSMS